MIMPKNVASLPIMQRSKSLPVNTTSHVPQPMTTQKDPLTSTFQVGKSSQAELKRSNSLSNIRSPSTKSIQLQLSRSCSAKNLSTQSRAPSDEIRIAKSPSMNSQDSAGSISSISSNESMIVDRAKYGIPPAPLMADHVSSFEEDMEKILHILETRDKKKLEELLEKHPKSCELINTPLRSYGSTPLMYASQLGCIDSVGTLIKFKAKIDMQANNGYTALMLAATGGHSNIVSTLIKQGANVKILTIDNISVLHKAVCSGNIEVLKTLRDEAFSESCEIVDQQSDTGFTALMMAAVAPNINFMKILLHLGSDVNTERGIDSTTSSPKDAIFYVNSLQNAAARKERIALISGFPLPGIEPGFVHVGVTRLARAPNDDNPSYLFVAMDEATGWACSRVYDQHIDDGRVDFLNHLHRTANFKITKLLAHNKELLNEQAARLYNSKITIDSINSAPIVEAFEKVLQNPKTKYAVKRFNELVGEVSKQVHVGFSSAANSQIALNDFLSSHNIEPLKYLDKLSITKRAKSLGRKLQALASRQFYQQNILTQSQINRGLSPWAPKVQDHSDDSDQSESSYHIC